MTITAENFLWVEKYRPKTIADCILPEDLKKTFQAVIDSGEPQNMLLAGSAGCGKTTVARALCDQMGLDYIFVNASENGNIDTLRTTIRNFASTVSLEGGFKVVILDEADHLNPQSTMPALRGFIEEFSSNCRFILTCNFKHKIIEPIHSRCAVIEFKIPNKQKPALAMQLLTRVEDILTKEGVTFDRKALLAVITKHFPDYRRILGELQRYAVSGTIDTGILTANYSELDIKGLVESMKTKNFTDVRKWVVQNSDADSTVIFRKIYDGLSTFVEKGSVPAIILILAEYQYKMAFSADPEICLTACMVEIMSEAKFV
jgi:DNA polymerase III delta prime subunit